MSLAEWRGAWAARGDNPLISYGLLSRRRRWLSVPWYRRYFAILLVGLGLTVAYIYTWLTDPSALSDPLWLDLMTITVGIGWIVFSLWLMYGVFEATTAALSFQGPERQRSSNLRLDDMVTLTRLSPAELALGAIMPLVRPLLERVIVLAAFNAVSLGAYRLADSHISGSTNMLDWVWLLSQPMELALGKAIFASSHPLLYTLFLMPLVVAPALIQGTLSAVALVALLVGLGRGIGMLGVTLAGLGFASAQLWLPIAGVATVASLSWHIERSQDWLLAIPLGLGLVAVFAALLRSALHHNGLRTLIAVGVPPLANLSLVALIPMLAPFWGVQPADLMSGLNEVLIVALSWAGSARWLMLWDPFVPQALASSYVGPTSDSWHFYLYGMGLLGAALMAVVSLRFCRASLQRRLRGG